MPFFFDNLETASTPSQISRPDESPIGASPIRSVSGEGVDPNQPVARGGPKPRLMVVITKADIGGAQTNVYDLVSSFRDHYDMHLVVGSGGLLVERVEALGIPTTVIDALDRNVNPLADLRCIKKLRRTIRTFGPQLIHAHSTKAGFVSRIAGRFERVPVIYTAHGWVFSPGFPLGMRLMVWLMELVSSRLGAHIVCVSHYDRRLAKKYLRMSEDHVSVVPCGIGRTAVSAKPGGTPARIIMVARFQEPKDHETAIRCVARLKPDSCVLRFVGSGPLMSEAVELASELQVSDQVEFLGDSLDVPELLADSDIFVLFSRHEGLPISILEAMRAGLPVIASDVGGISEEVEDHLSGLLVPNGDLDKAANAVRLLVDDVELRQQMGEAGRQIFERRFTRATMIEHFAEIYAANRKRG